MSWCFWGEEQINAGAVTLTDFVFWFIIVPFLMVKHYHMKLVSISKFPRKYTFFLQKLLRQELVNNL